MFENLIQLISTCVLCAPNNRKVSLGELYYFLVLLLAESAQLSKDDLRDEADRLTTVLDLKDAALYNKESYDVFCEFFSETSLFSGEDILRSNASNSMADTSFLTSAKVAIGSLVLQYRPNVDGQISRLLVQSSLKDFNSSKEMSSVLRLIKSKKAMTLEALVLIKRGFDRWESLVFVQREYLIDCLVSAINSLSDIEEKESVSLAEVDLAFEELLRDLLIISFPLDSEVQRIWNFFNTDST